MNLQEEQFRTDIELSSKNTFIRIQVHYEICFVRRSKVTEHKKDDKEDDKEDDFLEQLKELEV